MSTLSLKAIKSPGKLSERVRVQLEHLILAGKVRVNEQLPTESSLAESFGVSRTVIREAIHRLEAQGLVCARVGSGSYVVPFDKKQIGAAMGRFSALNPCRENFLNLLDLRMVIESETVQRAAETKDASILKRLADTLESMRGHREDLGAFAQADMSFHLTIAEAAGNPFFRVILEPLNNLGHDYGLTTYTTKDVMNRTCDEHARILRAIVKGDITKSRAAMRAHLDSSRTHYLTLVDSNRGKMAGSASGD